MRAMMSASDALRSLRAITSGANKQPLNLLLA